MGGDQEPFSDRVEALAQEKCGGFHRIKKCLSNSNPSPNIQLYGKNGALSSTNDKNHKNQSENEGNATTFPSILQDTNSSQCCVKLPPGRFRWSVDKNH